MACVRVRVRVSRATECRRCSLWVVVFQAGAGRGLTWMRDHSGPALMTWASVGPARPSLARRAECGRDWRAGYAPDDDDARSCREAAQNESRTGLLQPARGPLRVLNATVHK